MATNASTWFYNEPEQRAYLLEERVNHTFWANRITGLYFTCTSEEPPFRMQAVWQDLPLEIEWIPREYFKLVTQPRDDVNLLIVGIKEILGLLPTVSYVNLQDELVAEWHAQKGNQRLQEIQGDPSFREIKRYTK